MSEHRKAQLIGYGFKQNDEKFLLTCGNQIISVILFENRFEMVVSQEGKLTVTQIVSYNGNDNALFLNTYTNIITHYM